jgi:hypothetical protein
MVGFGFQSMSLFISRIKLTVLWSAIFLAVGIKLWTELTAVDEVWRFDPGLILISLISASIFAISTFRSWKKFTNPSDQLSTGTVVSGLLSAIIMVFGGPLWNQYPVSICGSVAGCFFLSVEPVPTDTVYVIWHADGYWSPILKRYSLDGELNYSEDGKYTESPALRLSKNENLLVFSRGGINVDAISLVNRRVITPIFFWDDPDVDEKMRKNSEKIAYLLGINS